ncbi:MAG: class I SAM-dependent methyltransferase [Candidatus Omnitrophota bacterium]
MARYYDDYWSRNAALWESTIYDKDAAGVTFVERVASLFRKALLIDRRNAAVGHLKDRIKGRVVLDLGCAGGLLCHELLKSGAGKAVGVDISPAAVDAAKKKFAALNIPDEKYEFLLSNVNDDDFTPPASDYVVSLGLVEYLRVPEIESLLAKIKGRGLFIAYEERQWWNPVGLCHYIYRKLKGFPYLTALTKKELTAILRKYGFSNVEFYSSGNNRYFFAAPYPHKGVR